MVAFGVIGLATSVLIVGNVVNGAVVSGYRRIGILKNIGFTPAQVLAAYVVLAGIPAASRLLVGVVLGNVLSVPLLSRTAAIYGVGTLLVPPAVDVAVPLLMGALVGIARCCRRCGPDGSARSRPSRPGAPHGPAAATPRTGCSAGYHSPAR